MENVVKKIIKESTKSANTKEVFMMDFLIIPTLYIDIQSLPPRFSCGICGGECYTPDGPCLRCERRAP